MLKSYLHKIAVAILFLSFFGCGPGIVLTDGNLNFLRGEKLFNVEYQYDNLMVGKITEDAYLKKKVSEKNAEEPGAGDEWVKKWFDDRELIFQPKFEKLLNKYLESKAKFQSDLKDTKYTLVLKTTLIEVGWSAVISAKDAHINIVALFVKTDDPQNVLAAIQLDECKGGGGSGLDFAVSDRVQEAYALAGEKIAKFILDYL